MQKRSNLHIFPISSQVNFFHFPSVLETLSPETQRQMAGCIHWPVETGEGGVPWILWCWFIINVNFDTLTAEFGNFFSRCYICWDILLRATCFLSFIPCSGGNSFYQQICHLVIFLKNSCRRSVYLDIFDNNMKDGINAFNVDKVALLLFVVDSYHAITHNGDILKVQSLVVIWEFSTDAALMGLPHHVWYCGLCYLPFLVQKVWVHLVGLWGQSLKYFFLFSIANTKSALHWLQ